METAGGLPSELLVRPDFVSADRYKKSMFAVQGGASGEK
jgi:hypothetical protein